MLTRRVLPAERPGVRSQLNAMQSQVGSGDVLNLGDQGTAVEALQHHLKAAGLYEGAVTGTFDEATRAAVQKLQSAKGLAQSGEVDAATLGAVESINLFVKDGFSTPARLGQRGKDILQAERLLQKLGYRPGAADGVFDEATLAALQRFRRESADLPNHGKSIDAKVFKELRQTSGSYEHAPILRRDTTDIRAHERLDARTARAAGRGNGLSLGDRGKSIENLEVHLQKAGYDPGRVDGVFDARTEAAVRAFQKAAGLGQTGSVGARTWNKLDDTFFTAKSGTSPAQREGEVSGAVKSTEKKLKSLGYDVGKVDGTFDARLERAVERFQRRHDLRESGRVGEGTMREINEALLVKSLGKGRRVTGYSNGRPFPLTVYHVGGGQYLQKEAAIQYKKMIAAARKDGIHLTNTSGFRTYAEQEALYRKYGPGRAARPGYSNHQQGLSMDIGGIAGYNSAAYRWLDRNAKRFGFVDDVPGEHWHWTYKR